MMLLFTDLLTKAGFDPSSVRLLRHQTRTPAGRTPYLLWRDRRDTFDDYQGVQTGNNRSSLAVPIWASFVVPPTGGTLFAGIYAAERAGALDPDWIDPLTGIAVGGLANDLDRYATTRMPQLEEYIGRLLIEWGAGARSWIQRPDRPNKPIVELTRSFREDAFPGYTHFVTNVSEVPGLPATWVAALRAAPT